MTDGEKRQARRVVRIGRETEQRLFTFIADLQEARHDDVLGVSWPDFAHRLKVIGEGIQMMLDLVNMADKETC